MDGWAHGQEPTRKIPLKGKEIRTPRARVLLYNYDIHRQKERERENKKKCGRE